MSEQNFFHAPDENGLEPSLDELLAEAKIDIDAAPGELIVPEEATADAAPFYPAADVPDAPSPAMPEPAGLQPESEAADPSLAPPLPHEFEPDFGDAFADYGEYEAQHPPLGDYVEDLPPDAEENALPLQEPTPPDAPRQKKNRRLVPLLVKAVLYVVIVGLIAVALGYGGWECAKDVMAFGKSEESFSVTVEDGATVDDIAQLLKDKGAIKYPWLFKFYCKFTHSEGDMEPGNYDLFYNYDYHALVKGMMANSPNKITVRVTIPEGYTAAQIFALMERNNVCTAEELRQCAANTEFDYWFLEGIPYGEDNRLEGFLFPDTYDFYENDDPERVVDKLLSNFKKKFSDEAQSQLKALNEAIGERLAAAGYDESYIGDHQISVYELMTVASMVEKEMADASEAGSISSVIYNRLCSPADYLYLNIDATLIYALGGSIDRELTDGDKQLDSPYNTYTHQGLPAGPISNPGLSSIAASLNPSTTNYYYYALDKSTGYHHFSETYEEHNAFLGSQASTDE